MTGKIDSKLDVGRSAAVYEVLPDKVYKGRVTIPVSAKSETGGRCGYPFVAGKRYLIYASTKAEAGIYLPLSAVLPVRRSTSRLT